MRAMGLSVEEVGQWGIDVLEWRVISVYGDGNGASIYCDGNGA